MHRVHRCCSFWKYFHKSVEKAKTLLTKNQYPEAFYEPIIKKTLTNILTKSDKIEGEQEEKRDRKLVFIEYRERVSENL